MVCLFTPLSGMSSFKFLPSIESHGLYLKILSLLKFVRLIGHDFEGSDHFFKIKKSLNAEKKPTTI